MTLSRTDLVATHLGFTVGVGDRLQRDTHWVLARNGHWYWLQAVRWCNDRCERWFSDETHWCEETLWAREQFSSTKVEIVKDVSKLRERGDITEPARVAAGEWGWPHSGYPTSPSTASDGNLSRSRTNTTGNP